MLKSGVILFLVFIREFLVSNWMMIKAVIIPQAFEGAFIDFRLEVRNPKSIAWISQMITLTPGTTTVDYSESSHVLRIYAFYGKNPKKVVSDIRKNFEAHLKAIWG